APTYHNYSTSTTSSSVRLSNGTTWSWSYEAANGQTAGFSNVAGADYTTSYNQGSDVQSVSYNAQSSNSNVAAV
ncbi:TPA: hypothetical protein I2108_RS13625, partial [Staphylococcus aureus]|nr:hypothetical protein [Staphylococcus aureus]HDH9638246.1 hypothetical protein [Staphylococcus aureus]